MEIIIAIIITININYSVAIEDIKNTIIVDNFRQFFTQIKIPTTISHPITKNTSFEIRLI